VRRGTIIALAIGVAAGAAAVIRAGAGAVAQALESLHVSGLLVMALLHLPIVVLMGLAWRLAAGEDPPASPARFLWARFVRDAAGEVLPFLYLGAVVFGVRALGRGRAIALGVVSACIDGVIELTAKLPYVLAALLTLLALGLQNHFTRLLSLALAATGVIVAGLIVAHRSLGASLGAMARVVSPVGRLCFPWTTAARAAMCKRASIGSSVSARAYRPASRCTSAAGVWAPARPGSSSGCSA
jgi:hypothetical protein